MALSEHFKTGIFDGVNEILIVPDPASEYTDPITQRVFAPAAKRSVSFVAVYNEDTVSVNVSVRSWDQTRPAGADDEYRYIFPEDVVLATKERIEDDGPHVTDLLPGMSMVGELDVAVTTDNAQYYVVWLDTN